MSNFSVKYSYTYDGVTYHKTAIVRASDLERAKSKIVNHYLGVEGPASSFSFDSISVSNYNLVLI